MVIRDDWQKILCDLSRDLSGMEDISITVVEDGEKLLFSTTVYSGDNYVPPSVRACLTCKPPFRVPFSHTHLNLNEEEFRIQLSASYRTEHLSPDALQDLIDDFAWMAEEWRYYLDENDRNDLIYVRRK